MKSSWLFARGERRRRTRKCEPTSIEDTNIPNRRVIEMKTNDKNINFETTIFKQGHSVATVIPKPCADYLGLKPGDRLKISATKVEG
jgi:hypothetical protein